MRKAAAKASSLETRIAGAEFLRVRSFRTHGITILVITEKEMLAFSLNYSRMTLYLQVLNLQTGAEFGDMTQILWNLGHVPLVLNSAPSTNSLLEETTQFMNNSG
jgi:hypothetical protein